LSFFKSGPGIMIAIMLVTTVILPKLMEGMDPQQMLADAQAQQSAQQQGQNAGNTTSGGQQSVQGGNTTSGGRGRNRRK